MTQTPRNTFKDALQAGRQLAGLWLGLADPYATEVCAGLGYDWLLIDGEHGPNDLRSMLGALQAAAPYDTEAVVRIPHGDAALIKQVLEIGARTLLVPMVETADSARALASAMRFTLLVAPSSVSRVVSIAPVTANMLSLYSSSTSVPTWV